MCRALGSSRTREKEPCDRVLSLPCGFHNACFQCHGISACVSDPPQATLPLFIHYYTGIKTAFMNWTRSAPCPFCANLSSDIRTLRLSGASVSGEQRLTLQSHATSALLPAGAHLTGRPSPWWRIPNPLAPMRSWHCPPTLQTVQSCQREVHSPRQHPVVPKWSCRTRQCPVAPKCSMSTRQA